MNKFRLAGILGLLIASWGLFFGAPAKAEPQIITLPGDYSDFAIDPETGDIAAVDPNENRAFLFRQGDLKSGRFKPAAELRVSSTPYSVCFKRYQDQSLFAVVCTQDSHMYLIRTKDFSLIEKVPLASTGIWNVTTSRNPEDPFLYYHYRIGQEPTAGVVSLRDQRDRGQVFDRAMDSAISADGLVAYRRGPHSPSGLESLISTSGLSADKPTFVRMYHEHRDAGVYLPDPFGRLVASGRRVYSRSLVKAVGELSFVPRAFSASRPVIFGTEAVNVRTTSTTVRLQAASYNTLTPMGKTVSLRLSVVPERDLPPGLPPYRNFREPGSEVRLFADDARDQILFAMGSQLVFVPLEDFDLPEEPFLLPQLLGPEKLEVGKPQELRLKARDPRVELTVVDTPDFVSQDGDVLKWTPQSEQVGEATIRVKASFQDIQATFDFDREVFYPSVALPFEAGSFAVGDAGDIAMIWTAPPAAPRRQAPETPHVALIDLKEGKVKAKRELNHPVQQAALWDNQAFVLQSNDPLQLEVWNLETLKTERTLSTSAPISRVQTVDDLIILSTFRGIEIFEAKSLRRLKQFQSTGRVVSEHGLLIDGVLCDTSLKPKLIVNRRNLPALPGANERWASETFEPKTDPANLPRRLSSHRLTPGEFKLLATETIPGTHLTVTLNRLTAPHYQNPESIGSIDLAISHSLKISGGKTDQKVMLSRTIKPSEVGLVPNVKPDASLATIDGAAYVLDGDRLYRWAVPDELVPGKPDAEIASAGQFQWEYRQSNFWISATENTTLKHRLKGGAKPIRTELLSPQNASTLDPESGDVTIDGKAVLEEAKRTLMQSLAQFAGSPSADLAKARMEQFRSQLSRTAEDITGKKPDGFPVAVPIALKAEDKNNAEAILQYYVLIDVPLNETIEPFEQMVAERASKMEAARRNPQGGRTSNDEVAELKKRVDSLEQKLDLVTRQLNQVLKKLDEMEKK